MTNPTGIVMVFKCTNLQCPTDQWEVTSHPATTTPQASVCGTCGEKGKKLPPDNYITGGVKDAG